MGRDAANRASAAARVLMRLEEAPGSLETPCWVWPGASSSGGYGYVRLGGGGKIVTVHSLLFGVLTGRRPRRDQHVHHRCDRTLCANPDHLEVLTRRQHVRRHHLKEVARCGHPFDGVMGRRRMRYCSRCRNERRRALYRERHAA